MNCGKAFQAVETAIVTLSGLVHRIGGGILFIMMFLTTADVLLRFMFNRPIKGALELTELMMVFVVFFGVAYVATRGEHVSVDLIVSRLSLKGRAVVETITTLISIVLFVLVTWQSVNFGLDKLQTGLTTAVLYIPIAPIIFILAFGYGLLTIVLIFSFIHAAINVTKSKWKLHQWLAPLLIVIVIAATSPLWLTLLPSKLPPITAGYIGLVIMIIMLFSGMPIGFVMALIGFLGIFYITGPNAALMTLGSVPYNTTASFTMSMVPLFILMGAFTFYTGLSNDLYDTVQKWLGHFRGGLAIATIGACAGFAAISGSSLATAATMGTVALPMMKKYNYSDALATSAAAVGGTLGILIPPSIVFVLYGILTNQSIGKLFMSGFLPGALQALFYIITIYILCSLNPNYGPPGPKATWKERGISLKNVWLVLVLFVLVIGGLFGGVFTPTEAAAIGAFGAFLIALFRRQLNWKNLSDSLFQSAKTSAYAFMILIGAMILGYFLAVTRLPFVLADLMTVTQLNRYVVLLIIIVIYLFLGCIMDSLAMVLLTVPIFFPIITSLQFDPIWFGVIVVRVTEIGLITPPVGVNVFIIKGVAGDVPMYTIFKGVVPFLIADFIHVGLLIVWPEIALFLPSFMSY